MHDIVAMTDDMKWSMDNIESLVKEMSELEDEEKQGRKYKTDKMAGRNTLQDNR